MRIDSESSDRREAFRVLKEREPRTNSATKGLSSAILPQDAPKPIHVGDRAVKAPEQARGMRRARIDSRPSVTYHRSCDTTMWATMAVRLALLALLVIANSGGAYSQQFRSESPQVQAEQKTDSPIESEHRAQQKDQAGGPSPTAIPKVSAQTDAEDRDATSKYSSEKGTEYWPWPILGFRLKITDSLLAVFSSLLVVFTGLLWFATKRVYKHTAASERAYVTISHHSPPGLDIDVAAGTARVLVKVRNSGRTPAYVTDVVLQLAFDSLPPPSWDKAPPAHPAVRHFLVTQTEFEHTTVFAGLDSDVLLAVTEDERRAWLVGYVDYRDSFKLRHRGGYMRRYERFDHAIPPDIPGVPVERSNNLIFDPTPGYNYDRPRRRWKWKREGNDWKDKD